MPLTRPVLQSERTIPCRVGLRVSFANCPMSACESVPSSYGKRHGALRAGEVAGFLDGYVAQSFRTLRPLFVLWPSQKNCRLQRRRGRDLKPSANGSNRSLLDLSMPRDGNLAHIGGVKPNVVITAVMVKRATMASKIAFEVRPNHFAPLISTRELLGEFPSRLVQRV